MVKAKKSLGQHFLKNESIASDIANLLRVEDGDVVLEIGPGTGVLTKYLINKNAELHLIELDGESVNYLNTKYPKPPFNLIHGNFLKMDLMDLTEGKMKIIGNFPYNISTQIFFKVLEYDFKVDEIVCMLQKEVAQRIASPPGSKKYGILSVLLQAYFTIDYELNVPPESFNPPPNVQSGVIRLVERTDKFEIIDKALFFRIVKSAFQNRRKKLRNALKNLNLPELPNIGEFADKRAEQLGVGEFLEITNIVNECLKKSHNLS